MAELADAPDLKSGAPRGAYGFDPRPGHLAATGYGWLLHVHFTAQARKTSLAPFLLLFDWHLYLEGFGCSPQACVYDVNIDVLSDGGIHVPK